MVWKFYLQHLSWWRVYLQVFPLVSLLGVGLVLINTLGSVSRDFEADIKYLADSKKEEAQDYRKEILRLKSSINRIKDGPAVTDTDMKNNGLGEVIMQLIPAKYRKAASFLVPQVEEAVKKDPTIVERIYEKIKNSQHQ